MVATAASSVAAAQQPKVEKKIMDEKIAKVREVVKNVSTNDIVLALHNFELDVARTIHAFCEGGSEVALGDWERTGGAKKRNQKKKSKGGAAAAAAATATNSLASSLPSHQSKTNVNNNNNSTNSGTTTPSVASSLLNCSNLSSATAAANLAADKLLLTNGSGGGGMGLSPPSAFTTITSTIHHHHQQQRVGHDDVAAADSVVVVHAEKSLPLPLPIQQQHHHQQQKHHQFVHPGEVVSAKADAGDHLSMANNHQQRMVGGGSTDSFGLVDYQSQLVQNREMLEREVSTAQDAIYHCFKELRDALAAREQQLLDELVQCRKDGHRYFDARTVTLGALIVDSGNPKWSSTQAFVSGLEKFNTMKTDDLEVALTARFLCGDDSSAQIAAAIAQLGNVPAVSSVEPTPPAQQLTNGGDNNINSNSTKKNAAAAAASVPPPNHPRTENVVKRSNSPSSLVSSVGEDSGLGGQISPVNHHVEKGQSVQVEENGIVLKSDTVSADQLAEIQRQIAETLKAKGIDPALLAGFGTATTVAARRRPPPTQSSSSSANASGANNKNGGGGGGSGQKRRK